MAHIGRPPGSGWTAREVKIDWTPLEHHLARLGGGCAALSALGHHPGTPERARWAQVIARGQRDGRISLFAADKIACELLNVHPAEVWGQEWWNAADLALRDPRPITDTDRAHARRRRAA